MIQPPGWCHYAVPTLRGWKHPRTSEMLKKRSFTQAQVDEWWAAQGVPQEAPAPAPVVEVAPVEEAPEENLEEMTKLELEALGREHGIELDRRKTKSKLVQRLKGVINSK